MPPHEVSQNTLSQGHLDKQSLNMTIGCPHCSKNVSVNVNLTVNHPHVDKDDEIKSESSTAERLKSVEKLADKSNVPPSEISLDSEPPDPGVTTDEPEFETSVPDQVEYSESNEPYEDSNPQNILEDIQSSNLELEELQDITSNQSSAHGHSDPSSVKNEAADDDEVIEIKEEPEDFEYSEIGPSDNVYQVHGSEFQDDGQQEVLPRSMLQRAEPMQYQTQQMPMRVGPRFQGFGRRPRRSPYMQAVMRQRAPPANNFGNMRSSVSQMRARNFQTSQAQGIPSSPVRQRQSFGANESMNLPQTLPQTSVQSDFSAIHAPLAQISAHEMSYSDSGDPMASTSQGDQMLDLSEGMMGDPGGDAAAGAPGCDRFCQICQKIFPSSWKFRRHMIVHSGEKPFKCELCGKGFTQNAHRKTHEMVVHNKWETT